MDRRKVIAEAWEFTQANKKMTVWYAFFPAMLTFLASIIYFVYQFYAFKSSPLFDNWSESFTAVALKTVYELVRDNLTSTLPFIIIIAVIGFLYVFIPSFCEGAIIQLVARKKNGHSVRTREGLKYGMLSFLPLFEYSWLVRTFSLVSILGEASYVARNLPLDWFQLLFPVFVLIIITGLIMTFLFTYTEYFIVIDGRQVFEAIVQSCKLVVNHLGETVLLSFLMLIILVRILLQIVFVFLVPGIFFAFVYFTNLLTTNADLPLLITIGGVLGMIALYIGSYINAVLHVFAVSVWTFTFLELSKEQTLSAREVLH